MPDIEPTPEFEAECQKILIEWHGGQLPFKEASDKFTELKEQAIASHHTANEARTEVMMGVMQSYRGNYTNALEHFDKAYAIFHHLGNKQKIVLIDLNIGEIHRNKGDYTRARKKYQTAKDAAADIGDMRLHIIAVVNEGLMLINMELAEAAIKSFERGLQLAPQWDSSPEELHAVYCEIYRGLALCNIDFGKPELAWEQAQKAFDESQHCREAIMRGYANRAMAESLSALIDHPPQTELDTDPDVYFQRAYDIFREQNADGEIGRTMYKHALSLIKRGKQMQAARKLQQAMLIFARRGMTQDAAKAAEAQGQVF